MLLRSGLTTAFSPFSGAPSPQKITPDGVNGLNEVVRLGTDGEWPLFDTLIHVFTEKDNLDAFALKCGRVATSTLNSGEAPIYSQLL